MENLNDVHAIHRITLGLCSIAGSEQMLPTTGKDTLSKVGDYSWEDCLPCQTTILSTPTFVSFSRDIACAYCPFVWQSPRTTDTLEGRLSVRSSSHEPPLSVTQALGTIVTFSSIFLPPTRRIVPRKQRMASRLGVSESKSNLPTFLTLENLAKESHGTRNSWRLLEKSTLDWLLEASEKHADGHI